MTKKLIIRTKGKTFVVNKFDILYCQAEGSYSYIHLVDKSRVLTSMNLSTLHNKIGEEETMLRVSQSNLINLLYLQCIHHANKELELFAGINVTFTITIREIEESLDKVIHKSL